MINFTARFYLVKLSLFCALYLQPTVSLRELGLSDLGVGQLSELVNRLLPRLESGLSAPPAPLQYSSSWRTSHLSSDSFFHNKHGENPHHYVFENVNVLSMCGLIAFTMLGNIKILIIMMGMNNFGENAVAVFLTYIVILRDF